MLGMKAWFEIRWRFLFLLTLTVAWLAAFSIGNATSPVGARKIFGAIEGMWLLSSILLAGSGIRTQAPFRPTKGLHGSTGFTLSLPVSRFRLLAVRVGVGLAAVGGIILISSTCAWILFPLVRTSFMPVDFLRWVLTASCCAVAVHGVSVLASTVLDDQWQVWGTVITIGVLKWLTIRFPPPPAFDVFSVFGERSPLLTGTLPWPAIVVTLGVAGILFLIATKTVQAIEY